MTLSCSAAIFRLDLLDKLHQLYQSHPHVPVFQKYSPDMNNEELFIYHQQIKGMLLEMDKKFETFCLEMVIQQWTKLKGPVDTDIVEKMQKHRFPQYCRFIRKHIENPRMPGELMRVAIEEFSMYRSKFY